MNDMNSRKFTLISWGVTILLVLALAGFAIWRLQQTSVRPAAIAEPTQAPTQAASSPVKVASIMAGPALERKLQLKTRIPDRPRYDVIKHTVLRGDSVFAISKEYNIKADTLLWANYDVLNDTPDSLRMGQELNIPPTDGVYYKVQKGDTVDSIAAAFEAKPDDILNWPGNNFDLTNPSLTEGDYIMIPGGHREYKQWIVPTIARGRSGTANVGGSACGGGAVGSGAFVWPAANHFLSGNDYYSGHLGIDIADGEGGAVYAADSGVVTMAAGGWNGGYGNVIQIDHGNGYHTLYAHLSQINVSVCQSVGAGQLIGLAGNTGNSFGAHLHFEVRLNGGFVNPWYVLP